MTLRPPRTNDFRENQMFLREQGSLIDSKGESAGIRASSAAFLGSSMASSVSLNCSTADSSLSINISTANENRSTADSSLSINISTAQATGSQASSMASSVSFNLSTAASSLSLAGVPRSLYDIQTVLVATADNTPAALTVGEQTLIGRVTGGDIDALTVAEIWSLIGNYAGMYRYASAAATVIEQVNEWTLLNGFTTGYVGGGWSFHDGEHLAITSYDDNGDGKTVITLAGHVLIDGDIISIAKTVSYDGVWIVEQVLPNTFVIDTPWVADEGAKPGEHGSHFQSAIATATGKYLVTYSLSVTPATANCVVEACLFYNATQQTKSVAQVKLGAVADYENLVGFSIIDVTVNGIVSLAIRNITDAGDFTVIDGNMTLVRVG